ncbi:MAG TPA: hypothetical protein DD001_10235 [Microcoleaceae bacterium UBA10368]|jgi:hypothetical protein|nr:hypothetical protein [Microcoleaceae cyanobacterium UBA10368]
MPVLDRLLGDVYYLLNVDCTGFVLVDNFTGYFVPQFPILLNSILINPGAQPLYLLKLNNT